MIHFPRLWRTFSTLYLTAAQKHQHFCQNVKPVGTIWFSHILETWVTYNLWDI